MLDALFFKEFFNIGVLEFGSIVTSYFLDWENELLLFPSNEYLHLLLNLALVMQENTQVKQE